ncbi:MAG TPA: DUF6328 family protein [Rhodocyclaceae bacterium]|nr:DUF6328 family protein [Rhodocyclaceae bacterium]
MAESDRPDGKEDLPLSQAAQNLLEECRMVLPGIQALFGFQLIAVFNDGFASKLDRPEQLLHLAAIGLVVVAMALVMTPAAYHRQALPKTVTDHFIGLSSRLLLWSMFPLALGIAMDFYLIANLVTGRQGLAAALAAGLLALFFALWLALPWSHRRKRD